MNGRRIALILRIFSVCESTQGSLINNKVLADVLVVDEAEFAQFGFVGVGWLSGFSFVSEWVVRGYF